MKQKFCPSCGRETEDFFDGLCKECFAERSGWIDIPDRVEIAVCSRCGKKKVGFWEAVSMEDALEDVIIDEMKINDSLEKLEIVFDRSSEKAEITVAGSYRNASFRETKDIDVDIKEAVCDTCKKIGSGSYEAVVQIRAEEERLDDVLRFCEKVLKERQSGPVISDTKKRKNGLDLFLLSNSTAKYLAKKLTEKYDVERKDSKSLKGLVEGTKVYKSTYLVRFHKVQDPQ